MRTAFKFNGLNVARARGPGGAVGPMAGGPHAADSGADSGNLRFGSRRSDAGAPTHPPHSAAQVRDPTQVFGCLSLGKNAAILASSRGARPGVAEARWGGPWPMGLAPI